MYKEWCALEQDTKNCKLFDYLQETTAAIALRLFELNLIPVKRMEENWMMQLKNLFALTDFEIPGYEVRKGSLVFLEYYR